MQVQYFTITVKSLGDKYFGRKVTDDLDEIMKIFKKYANRHMEHVCSTIKDVEFCQCLEDFGITYDVTGQKFFKVVIKVCSYMPVDWEWIRTECLLDHYLMTYTY